MDRGWRRLRLTFNPALTHQTHKHPNSLRETLLRVGKKYFRAPSSSSSSSSAADTAAGGSAGSSVAGGAGGVGAGRSARAKQAQAFIEAYKAAFERDFRLMETGTASAAAGQPPLNLREVRFVVVWVGWCMT